MNALRLLVRAHWRTALGAALGAAGGAAYAHFIGCRTGTCPLTSKAWTAALFFGFAGGLVGWPAKRAPESSPDRPGAREAR